MDLTRLYIKQCAEAIELQQLWRPQTGDWVFIDLPEEFIDPVVLQRENSWPKGVYVLMANWKPKDAVWLLRQDPSCREFSLLKMPSGISRDWICLIVKWAVFMARFMLQLAF